MDKRFVFSPVYSTWNQILPYYKQPANPSLGTYFMKPFQKTFVSIALAIATVAAVIFSLCTLPYRYYQTQSLFSSGLATDLQRISAAEREIVSKEILSYMNEKCSGQISKHQQKEMIEQILAYYSRSYAVYGPIVRAWTEHLLEKAHRENKKLVFLARDGTVPYKMAKKLMERGEYREKYPNLTSPGSIGLAYFSRKVVHSSRELLKEYVKTELGLQEGDSCLFVDIGFEGSMIDTIRKELSGIEIEFHYLISLTDRASGFLATPDAHLTSVSCAGGNLGIHWLEDSHQGALKSPRQLVKGQKPGDSEEHIYPDTLFPTKQRCVERYSLEHLMRKFCSRAILKWADQPAPQPGAFAKLKATFDDTLRKIKFNELPLLASHY